MRIVTLLLLLLLFFPHVSVAATLNRPGNSLGMSIYWPLDEGTGTRALDKSGNRNDATLVNTPTWVSGKYGKALQFDGLTSYITKASANNLPTSAVTVSAWVKINAHANWYDLVKNNWGTTDANAPWNLFSDSSGRINFGIWPRAGADQGMFYAQGCATTFTTGAWHHVVGTYDGNTLVAVYLDGVLCGTAASGIAHTLYTAGPIIAGETGDGTTHQLDDIRIYRRAFSAAEVAALYRQGKTAVKTVARTGLVGEWKFDEGTSTKAHDSSGKSSSATLFNGATWVTGKHGKALQVDGITQYASVPDSNSLNNSSLTASFWFTLTSDPECDANNNWRSLIRKGNTSGANTGWDVVLEQDKSLQFDVGLAGVTSRSGGINVGMQVGVPIYLTFTYDAATGAQKIWANGVNISTKSNTPAAISSNTFLVYLGGGTSGVSCPNGSGYTAGKYDDVRIYNRALTSDEIYALYKERAVAVNTSQNTKLTNGLVGLWSFDGADIQGTTAYDRSGSGNNGTLSSSPSKVIGKIGQALAFDGVASYVDVSTAAPLALTQGTVSAWIRATNAGTGYRGIVGKTSSYGLYLQDNILVTYDNGTALGRSTGVSLNDNKWHHVSMSFDSGVTNGTFIYIDGALVLTTTTTTPTGSTLRIGRGQGGAGQTFNGSIDEVRVYNRILPASEIKQLYLMGK